jgi:hypothetical protein
VYASHSYHSPIFGDHHGAILVQNEAGAFGIMISSSLSDHSSVKSVFLEPFE